MKKNNDIKNNQDINASQPMDPKKVTELESQCEEWKNKYLRVLADYQNLEKRTISQVDETRKYAAERIIVRILSILDTFERAQSHLKDQGLELALKEFYAMLQENGVIKMLTVGKEFNPHDMECIEVVEGEENKVIEEVQAGYTLHQKVIRVAQVKVGRNMVKSTHDKSTNKDTDILAD